MNCLPELTCQQVKEHALKTKHPATIVNMHNAVTQNTIGVGAALAGLVFCWTTFSTT